VAELVKAEGGSAKAMELLGRGRAVVAAMPPARRSKLIVYAMVLAAACAVAGWWASRTEWKTLYSGMEGRDVQQVEGELAAASIAYQSTPDGLGVQVPSELLDKARMEVATKGMPQSGRMGFELFDKPNWVGSEFDEKVNYQRALEGELEHTIGTISSVRSARVHLVLPHETLFSSEQQTAKASVVLKLKRTSLRPDEVDSIRNLVAGAVEGLNADQVMLVDADGRTNLSSPGRDQQAGDEEQALEQKLVAMLEPLAGRENVRATVNLVYDQGSFEKTDEIVDPAQVVTLTTQKTDQMASSASRPGGVPGTGSNTASVTAATAAANGAAAKEPLPVYPSATPSGQSSHEENSTFAVTRHVTHEQSGPGRILRVTAAVLVNDRSLPSAKDDGQSMVWKPRTPDEMKRLEELAQAAIGFDPKRGDSVVLQNISFEANAPGPKQAATSKLGEQARELLRTQPELVRELGIAFMAVLLVMFVVRPVAKQTMLLLQEPRALTAGSVGAEHALHAPAGAAAMLTGGASQESLNADKRIERVSGRRPLTLDHQAVLEHVATHIRTAPVESTRLFEAWISDRGEKK
jgi:flagellar M-ring protein FliF